MGSKKSQKDRKQYESQKIIKFLRYRIFIGKRKILGQYYSNQTSKKIRLLIFTTRKSRWKWF